jgi:hypothetical protein
MGFGTLQGLNPSASTTSDQHERCARQLPRPVFRVGRLNFLEVKANTLIDPRLGKGAWVAWINAFTSWPRPVYRDH